MKRWGQKGPENYNRSQALKLLEACDYFVRLAFQRLAEAGAPRVPKPHREKALEGAHKSFDLARARLTSARHHFRRCQDRVTDRTKPEPHDKAAVTLLEPMIRESTGQIQTLRRLLVAYVGTSFARQTGGGEEIREANDMRSSLFSRDDGVRHRCNWCAEVERYSDSHYALDADGFAVKRDKAVRFCCYSCFAGGKDLQQPAPKALPPGLPLEKDPETETVECVLTPRPALPAAAPARPAELDPQTDQAGAPAAQRTVLADQADPVGGAQIGADKDRAELAASLDTGLWPEGRNTVVADGKPYPIVLWRTDEGGQHVD